MVLDQLERASRVHLMKIREEMQVGMVDAVEAVEVVEVVVEVEALKTREALEALKASNALKAVEVVEAVEALQVLEEVQESGGPKNCSKETRSLLHPRLWQTDFLFDYFEISSRPRVSSPANERRGLGSHKPDQISAVERQDAVVGDNATLNNRDTVSSFARWAHANEHCTLRLAGQCLLRLIVTNATPVPALNIDIRLTRSRMKKGIFNFELLNASRLLILARIIQSSLVTLVSDSDDVCLGPK
eukprot:m.68503 g.68503  ORF g.68503 m.68503 type:complete len:245 (-) comp50013_c0_seq21:1185-1919(-)